MLFAIPLAVIVYAFIDVLTTRPHTTKRGPKALWAIAVLLLPVVGAVLWFLFGRPSRRRAAAPRVVAPDDDPEFLRDLDRRTHKPEDPNDDPQGSGSAGQTPA
ncbi:MAG: hypothetical protein QG597_3918 [Actinomycetota bacterium]|nr:hypothetical protein [Actinomycetota bacterium]